MNSQRMQARETEAAEGRGKGLFLLRIFAINGVLFPFPLLHLPTLQISLPKCIDFVYIVYTRDVLITNLV